MTDPSNPLSIDREWAESLVGLRMIVESSWWDGYDDSELNPGVISAIDFSDKAGRFFQLELDDEPGAYYPMRYDAVLKYSDETHGRHSSYHLPSDILPDPEDETVTLAQLANSRLPTSRQTPRPTVLHDSTTDEYNAQDPSSDNDDDDASYGANNDDEWNEEEEDNFIEKEDIEFADEDDDVSSQSDSSESASQPNPPQQDNNHTVYKRTAKEEWDKIGSVKKVNGQNVTITARDISAIPYTGESEEFTPNITPEELASLKDASGDIRFEK
eukprot:scaffold10033_cov103-Cyclotella_meneghiniana.AAC.1